MIGAEILAQLKAKGQGNKYSDNFAKWLKKYKEWPVYVTFSCHSFLDGAEVEYDKGTTQAHHIIICIGEDDGFATGSRLSEIIGKGAKADRYAFPIRSFKIINLPEWWDGYLNGGKCFIDPQHRLYTGDERWQTGKRTRECKWCGYHQERRTKRKTYYIWQ